MKCMILGCERPARGNVDWVLVEDVTVPAHFCRYCWEHPCELEYYLLHRPRR